MADQVSYNIIAETGIIHDAHKRGAQLHIGNIFHYIAADSSVHLNDTADIAPSRNILAHRIPLYINKCCSDHDDPHFRPPFNAFVSDSVLLRSLLRLLLLPL